jgi:hypothetical protein
MKMIFEDRLSLEIEKLISFVRRTNSEEAYNHVVTENTAFQKILNQYF